MSGINTMCGGHQYIGRKKEVPAMIGRRKEGCPIGKILPDSNTGPASSHCQWRSIGLMVRK
ncbi:hypothetical protein HMPREF9141_1696 [Prevotella multiformis DSM 16608]|uniref:Uncharacterized protein n=1 Tax=Prevotella multiformis DSM 16608 TaxID=888743 RepID=F0F7X9_9BACT|nr:hypothetical protein HMPREF9141_1696 [Prevotella multiformis DSM 16608]